MLLQRKYHRKFQAGRKFRNKRTFRKDYTQHFRRYEKYNFLEHPFLKNDIIKKVFNLEQKFKKKS